MILQINLIIILQISDNPLHKGLNTKVAKIQLLFK